MQTQSVTVNQIELPRYRVVRGFEGVVRVDIPKAQEAMKYAMVLREKRRASDEERNKLIGSHATG
jgi:predicted NUDIX family phosphoesterase